MNLININEVEFKKKENDLIHFKGFIPFQICNMIDMLVRDKYLESVGKYDEVAKENYRVRTGLKKSNDSEEYLDIIFNEWIEDNPQFKDIII